MSERYLSILEVSQKQAYIFSSNKLQDNIINSAVIAWVMSVDYFLQTVNDENLFTAEKNLVYSGGGHTVLEFDSEKNAKEVIQKITKTIRKEYPGIEVFATSIEYVEYSAEEGGPGSNFKRLTEKLERKKALRRAAFHQGSFGIEKIDTNTLKPILIRGDENRDGILPEAEEKIDKNLSVEGYDNVFKFEDLGGSKEDSNFIAVVHIDGNAMGKRVENLREKYKDSKWEDYKEKIKHFSEAIDKDFKDTYKKMIEDVGKCIEKGNLKKLNLKDRKFPVRRIITAGDDICFVTEGRIGIECAAHFIQILNGKTNEVDKESYAACAGVAIVHQKYPFYKAYELSEMLCSNAKKFGASLSSDGTGKDISAIDWHIEFGELKDTLEEIREGYTTADGNRLEMRPYIISASETIWQKETIRKYSNFKSQMNRIWKNDDSLARGKMKNLRQALKQGEEAAKHFITFNKMKSILNSNQEKETEAFVETEDKVKRAVFFDAIEISDAYIVLDLGEDVQ